ncbi:MAG TPA: YeeE/YedE thiosulfate transporter family protein [Burkholderiaceae bacterium]|nr:YeeE/YedE thiosulfate transporter family protein [Burkholderiaceae bacterium]
MNRHLLSVVIAVFFVLLLWFVSLRQAILFLVGTGMGGVLAGARFGFTTGWRRLIEQRDGSGVMAQLWLLFLAAAVSMPLLAAFPGELNAALGPPSYSLLIGAFVFGACMQVADGCGSGTLYKAGLGIPLNMVILPMFALGSFLGAAQLDNWLALGTLTPVSLVAEFGAVPALALTGLGLLALGGAARLWAGRSAPWLNRRLLIGAVLLAVLAVLNLVLAGTPWGIVYGFGLWAGKIATATGAFDPTANAFWGQPMHLEALSNSVFMDVTSITNIGILAGALWIAARPAKAASSSQCAGQTSRPASPSLTAQQWAIGIVAGFLLGYSSRLAFGCNIGAMVSGISTGSLHGWIWVPVAFVGSLLGVRIRRHYQF